MSLTISKMLGLYVQSTQSAYIGGRRWARRVVLSYREPTTRAEQMLHE